MIKNLILASASTARARLLGAAGLEVRVEPTELDEAAIKQAFRAKGCQALGCALALAEAKARWVADRHDRFLVIGADQILVCGDVWFDRPWDLGAARTQLKALRGRTHELATAICAVQAGALLWHAVSRPRLAMRVFSDEFLDDYIAAEGAGLLGSVGAYRLEGRGVQLFESIEGDHFAILGLPLLELLRFLRDRGEIAS
jgi:septum formation protein